MSRADIAVTAYVGVDEVLDELSDDDLRQIMRDRGIWTTDEDAAEWLELLNSGNIDRLRRLLEARIYPHLSRIPTRASLFETKP